jgi:hypothetical protein
MSRKIQIVLPDPQADQLAELAAGTGEPQSTLAGLLSATASPRQPRTARFANSDKHP